MAIDGRDVRNSAFPFTGCAVGCGLVWLALSAAAVDAPAPTTPIVRYDASWHVGNFWSGENATGLTVLAPQLVAIRTRPDLGAAREVSCQLDAPAVYHPLNFTRAGSDNLVFRSYTKIVEGTVTAPYTGKAKNVLTHVEETLNLGPGTRVRVLAYAAGGFYDIEVNGTVYFAWEGFLKRTTAWPLPGFLDDANYHQWLSLPCANGVRGWLFVNDVKSVPGIITMPYRADRRDSPACDVATAVAQSVCRVSAPPVASPSAYDATWHASDRWHGDVPNGFSVVRPTTITLRSAPDPKLGRALTCRLTAPATYHPWNAARVRSDRLVFRAYTKIVEATIADDYSDSIVVTDTGEAQTIDFRKGDRWRFLEYLKGAEFLIEFRGKNYISKVVADHSVIGDTRAMAFLDKRIEGADAYQEWLNLPCANGVRGWLLLSEVLGITPGITAPHLGAYQQASDRPLPSGYDASWFAANFWKTWAGNSPSDFFLSRPLTIAIRSSPDPKLAPGISCVLAASTIFDPRDYYRSAAQQLTFRSYTRTFDATIVNTFSDSLYSDERRDGLEVKFDFRRGERWRFLGHVDEDGFLVEFRGHQYYASYFDDLLDNSVAQGKPASRVAVEWYREPGVDSRYQDWLHLPCANGARGWLFVRDLERQPGVISVPPELQER
jgi:hypothetical protein